MATKREKAIKEFINCYRKLPVLWKIKDRDYTDRRKKRVAYKHLVEKYQTIVPNADMELVKKKINSLRTVYRRELKRVRESQKVGTSIYVSYFPYFEEMKFLSDQEFPSEGRSALAIGDETPNIVSQEVNKIKTRKGRSGTEEYVSNWPYFTHLQFLTPGLSEKSSQSNLGMESRSGCSTDSQIIEVPMYEAQDVAESSMDSETLQLSASLAQIPALETSLSVPSEQSVKKLKKRSCEKSRFEDTLKILQDSFQRDEFSIFGEHVANELRKLQPAAYSMVEHLINNILYEASMGKYDNPTWPPVASQSQDNPDIDNTDGFGNRQKNFDEYSGAVSPASSHTSSTANPVWPISVISGSHQASSPVAVMQESLTDEVTKKKRTGLEDNIKDPGKVDRPGDDGGTKELRKSRSGSTDVLTTRSSHENIPPATDTLHDDRAIDNDTDGKKGGRDKDNQEKSKPPDDLQPPLKKLKRKYSMETIDIFDKENVPVFKTRSDPINDAEYHFLLSLLPELRKIPEDRKLTARIRIQQVLSEEQELKAI